MHSFFLSLEKHGFQTETSHGSNLVGSVQKPMREGFISVSNDFCTHILEVAFPPLTSAKSIRETFTETFELLNKNLHEQGMAISFGGILERPPEGLVLVPHRRRQWYENRVPQRDSEFWTRYPTTLMSATQVHLNVHDSGIYPHLPFLYSKEYLVPYLFSNSRRFMDGDFGCARALVWMGNQPRDYGAWAIPEPIPASRQDYDEMLARCVDFSRDFSFIAPRSFGSIEFRSACSQNTVEDILELITLRISLLLLRTASAETESPDSLHNHFNSVCRDRAVDPAKVQSDFELLKSVEPRLPETWLPHYRELLKRVTKQPEMQNVDSYKPPSSADSSYSASGHSR